MTLSTLPRRTLQRLFITIALVGFLCGGFATAEEAIESKERTLTIEDVLSMQSFGAALVSSDGSYYVFEQQRPYDEAGDYSFGTYAMQRSASQIWRYDVESGVPPYLLRGLNAEPFSYLQGFSPSGRYLLLYQYRFGDIHLVVYDTELESVRRFEQPPALGRAGEHEPVWVSDDEFVFSALPHGHQPISTGIRVHTGRTLANAWWRAWRGSGTTADEVTTRKAMRSDLQQSGRLIIGNARSGESKTLAEGLFSSLRLSPDNRYLAALAILDSGSLSPSELVEGDSRRHKLIVFDLETETSISPLSNLEYFPYSLEWDSFGRRLVGFAWASNAKPQNGRYWVLDLKTGQGTRYDHAGLDLVSERERGWLQRPERAIILGEQLIVFARKIPKNETQLPRFSYQEFYARGLTKPDWFAVSPTGNVSKLTVDLAGVSGTPVHAGSNDFTVSSPDGAFRIYKDGSRKRLTPKTFGRYRYIPQGSFTTRSSVARPIFSWQAMFKVNSDSPHVVIIDLREGHEGEYRSIKLPSEAARPLAGNLTNRSLLLRADHEAPTELVIIDREETEIPIARLNEHLAGINLGHWTTLEYAVEDPNNIQPPQTLESCILLPPGYDAHVSLPLIVDIYPDARPNCVAGEPPRLDAPEAASEYLWAARGFAYARLTTPLDLIQTEEGPIAGIDEVIDAGVEALVDAGMVDPDRVALFGFSQGGISALYSASQSSNFKAVIAINSWADLFSHYFGGNGIYSYTYGQHFAAQAARYDPTKGNAFGIGRSPFSDPSIYYNNSPVFLAPHIDAPVMLITSDMDAFSMSQFDEMFGALTRAGKKARYVRYWGEGHMPSSPANIYDLWDRMLDFLSEEGVAP